MFTATKRNKIRFIWLDRYFCIQESYNLIAVRDDDVQIINVKDLNL